jgi:hypothetical protein
MCFKTLSQYFVRGNHGRAIAQAFSRRLPTAATRIRGWVRSCGICGGQSDTGAGYLRVLRFPLPIFILPTAPHSSSTIIQGWYVSGRSTKWTVSLHPKKKKKKRESWPNLNCYARHSPWEIEENHGKPQSEQLTVTWLPSDDILSFSERDAFRSTSRTEQGTSNFVPLQLVNLRLLSLFLECDVVQFGGSISQRFRGSSRLQRKTGSNQDGPATC